MKACSQCGQLKELSEFSKHHKNKDGHDGICKTCKAQYRKDHWQRTPRQAKNSQLKCKYGITLEEWDKLLIDQQGHCAICGESLLMGQINTDHNHITKNVRGLLCNKCNLGLGCFQVDEKKSDLLLKAMNYLQNAGEL